MGFNQFLGNRNVVDTLKLQLKKGCLPHSLLFCGIQGVGKATLALYLAKATNCQTISADFCDSCESCRKIDSGTHPDVRLYQADGQFIKIDQMRTLSREVFYCPFEGRRRVFVIDEADRMKPEAANSILKTLEEPPESSILILVTAKPNDLLPTIRSRCQVFRFLPIPQSEMEQLLSKRDDLSSQDRLLVSRIAGGSVARALTFDLPTYKIHRQEAIHLIETCVRKLSYVSANKHISEILDKRELSYFEEKMQILQSLLRDVYLLKLDPSTPFLINLDLIELLDHLGQSISLDQIQRASSILWHLERGASRNLNKNLALDQFVFELSGEYSGLTQKNLS
jgi:DNA polymerase-3 subunit delta'